MKTILNKLSIFILFTILAAGFTSCEKEDYLVFTAQAPVDSVNFTNSFSDEYLLSSTVSSNTAERFVWNEPDFGAPTIINYEVEGSVTPEFETIDYSSGTLTENNIAIKVSTLMGLATLLELDTDPTTTNDAGEPNNVGVVYFRVKAFVGTPEATNGESSLSDAVSLNISLVEDELTGGSGISISSWGIIGSAANDWGNAGPDLPFYTTNEENVFVAYANLKDGEIKFRENNDWASNFGDTGADGTLDDAGDNILVTAGDYKITLNFNDNTYTLENYSWGIVGSAFNDWGNDGPDARLFYDYTTNTFKGGVKLLEGEMKFRLNNDWGLNYGDTGVDGTLDNGGDNIITTPGYYAITLDLANNSYTIEPADLYGIVGSGYNDWGNAGPDFLFTEIHEGIWMAQNVTLLDGAVKFRINEDWAVNYGDTGADKVLDANGDDIITTAGTFDIMLDFTDAAAPTYSMIAK